MYFSLIPTDLSTTPLGKGSWGARNSALITLLFFTAKTLSFIAIRVASLRLRAFAVMAVKFFVHPALVPHSSGLFFIYLCFMPVISMFYGIVIMMYYLENKQHHLPHIHVKYQGKEAVISIPQGKLIEGSLPSNKMKLLQAWIEIHKDELMTDWELAKAGKELFKIQPLK